MDDKVALYREQGDNSNKTKDLPELDLIFCFTNYTKSW